MDKHEKIMQRVYAHRDTVQQWLDENKCGRLLGVFLYGSQNYGCDTELSDVDTKAIIIPTADSILKGGKCREIATSLEVMSENGKELCDVKDIQSMFSMFKKQNINYLEILYTDFFYVTPHYNDFWMNRIIPIRDDVVSMDLYAHIMCCLGMMKRKFSSILKPTEGTRSFFDKWGYNYKDYIHILRIWKYSYSRFACNRSFIESLNMDLNHEDGFSSEFVRNFNKFEGGAITKEDAISFSRARIDGMESFIQFNLDKIQDAPKNKSKDQLDQIAIYALKNEVIQSCLMENIEN